MATAAYMELAMMGAELAEEAFATATDLANAGFGFTNMKIGGRLFDLRAPDQLVGNRPVTLRLVDRGGPGNVPPPATALAPAQALFQLMRKIANSSLAEGMPQKARAWLSSMKYVNERDLSPMAIRQALQLFLPRQQDAIFKSLDPGGALRASLSAMSGPRPGYIAGMKLDHGADPLPVPMQPTMSASSGRAFAQKRWACDQWGTPFATSPLPIAA